MLSAIVSRTKNNIANLCALYSQRHFFENVNMVGIYNADTDEYDWFKWGDGYYGYIMSTRELAGDAQRISAPKERR